jgi:CRP-like cAMP-binding protein
MYSTLTACPLFRGLSPEKIEDLLGDRQISADDYADRVLIARQDTAYSGLMIILRGRVRGESTDASGRKTTIDTFDAPQLIAPAFLFGGYNRLPIDVVAEGPVTILTLHRGLIFELMQENTIILSNFVDIISDRANRLSRKIYFLSFRSLREKLAHYLLEHTTKANPATAIDLNELSEYFDASRNSILTVIADLEKHRTILYAPGRIEVLNRKSLGDNLS